MSTTNKTSIKAVVGFSDVSRYQNILENGGYAQNAQKRGSVTGFTWGPQFVYKDSFWFLDTYFMHHVKNGSNATNARRDIESFVSVVCSCMNPKKGEPQADVFYACEEHYIKDVVILECNPAPYSAAWHRKSVTVPTPITCSDGEVLDGSEGWAWAPMPPITFVERFTAS
jgi:hypothetical protein